MHFQRLYMISINTELYPIYIEVMWLTASVLRNNKHSADGTRHSFLSFTRLKSTSTLAIIGVLSLYLNSNQPLNMIYMDDLFVVTNITEVIHSLTIRYYNISIFYYTYRLTAAADFSWRVTALSSSTTCLLSGARWPKHCSRGDIMRNVARLL